MTPDEQTREEAVYSRGELERELRDQEQADFEQAEYDAELATDEPFNNQPEED